MSTPENIHNVPDSTLVTIRSTVESTHISTSSQIKFEYEIKILLKALT